MSESPTEHSERVQSVNTDTGAMLDEMLGLMGVMIGLMKENTAAVQRMSASTMSNANQVNVQNELLARTLQVLKDIAGGKVAEPRAYVFKDPRTAEEVILHPSDVKKVM